VDYTGFNTINSQRFGQRFVGKVANPHDILLWSKSAVRKSKEEGKEDEENKAGLGLGLRPEQLDQTRIEYLVAQHLGDK
jgi:double-strand break repair protein MRE11